MKNNNKGFSLVELIVVIAIMAILAAIAIPTFAHFITKANEASDAELLHNINYIFNASCVENGVDIKDVTAATWNKTEKKVENVSGNGISDETAEKIEASFVLHFGDLKDEEFINITEIVFDAAKHEFVDKATATSIGLSYGGGYIYVSPEDLAALQNSTFGEKIGMEALLNQLNEVTILAAGLSTSEAMASVLGSADFRASAAAALGVADSELDAELNRLAEEMMAKEPELSKEEAIERVKANAAVLFAAQQTVNMQNDNPDALIDFLKNDEKKQETILNNMSTNPGLGMAQASLICGMYTAYIQTDYYKDAHPNTTPVVNAETVLEALETDTAFQTYLNSPQAEIDMNGYLGSLNMIENSTDDSKAVNELMVNGFNDPALVEQMSGLTK